MNYTFQRANNKDTDQTERMRSPVCAFDVRMQQRQVFLRRCPYFTAENSIECVFGCFCYISNNVIDMYDSNSFKYYQGFAYFILSESTQKTP